MSVELNTGFESSDAGISAASKIGLHTKTPTALVDDSGILKRKVIEPDAQPRVGLDKTNPPNAI